MTITAAMERDPAFRGASWRTKAIYPQLRRHARIEAPAGCDVVEALVFSVKGLSSAPRSDVEEALAEMRARGLVREEGGALIPKHAPRPRPELPRAAAQTASGARRAPGATSLPADADARLRAGFRVHLSRHHRDDPRRADPAVWNTVVAELWEVYCRDYGARPQRRRASDPVTADAPAVTPGSPSAVTPVTPEAVTAAVTAVTEGGPEGEKESLSPSGGFDGEITLQSPRAREATPVTPAVTPPDVTAVTAPAAPESAPVPPSRPSAPPTAPALTSAQLRNAFAEVRERVGSAGRSDRKRVHEVLREEGFTVAELRAFVRLAKKRRLYLQEKHERVSLHFLLRDDAAILHRWIDDVRAELARQPELGLAANDASAAARTAPKAPASVAAAAVHAAPANVQTEAPATPALAQRLGALGRLARPSATLPRAAGDTS